MIKKDQSKVVCPEDDEACEFYNPKKGIKSFPINRAIQKFLLKQGEQRNSRDSNDEELEDSCNFDEHESTNQNFDELCEEHNQNTTLVCFTEKKLICPDCALFGKHKDHKYMKMVEYRQEIKERYLILDKNMNVLDEDVFLNKGQLDKQIKEQTQES